MFYTGINLHVQIIRELRVSKMVMLAILISTHYKQYTLTASISIRNAGLVIIVNLNCSDFLTLIVSLLIGFYFV